MLEENNYFDIKSIRTVRGSTADFNELAKDCVAFANAKGGTLYIGIEDKDELPPKEQIVDENLPSKIQLRISQLTINVYIVTQILTASNGAEYIALAVQQNTSTIASTTDGKYYIRIGDQSVPLHPDQLLRLLNDKPSFNWETKITTVHKDECDKEKYAQFLKDIRSSDRVSPFVKDKSDSELLEYYMFSNSDYLTNLGVLWIGKRNDRVKLRYAPAIQFIKYDERGVKVNKLLWDDYSLNPKELIDAVWNDIPDWKEGVEINDGIYRDFIPNYGEITIRELITNAIVHRPYTTAGDIFINLYPDKLEIHNPGTFPIGVTSKNILHESRRRNEHLCKVAYDLMLMEKEGSGFDVIYEDLLSNGKPIPIVEEFEDRVVITISRLIHSSEAIKLNKVLSSVNNFTRKEKIAFGLIYQNNGMSSVEFTRVLDLKGNNPTRPWIEKLVSNGIIVSQGKTRGTEYKVNKERIRDILFTSSENNFSDSDKLMNWIYQDIKIHPDSSIAEISERINHKVSRYKIRIQLKRLIDAGKIQIKGTHANTRYACKK